VHVPHRFETPLAKRGKRRFSFIRRDGARRLSANDDGGRDGKKSSTAEPSRKNSGLDTTSKEKPVGVVDGKMLPEALGRSGPVPCSSQSPPDSRAPVLMINLATEFDGAQIPLRRFSSGGVPTQMKMASLFSIASAGIVNSSRPEATLRFTKSSRCGLVKGQLASF